MDNKKLAQTAQQILKTQGHDIPVGHVYELFSKLVGHPSWNVAKVSNVVFAKVLDAPTVQEIAQTVVTGDGKLFDVKIKASYDGEVTKYYRINAESERQAKEVITEYLDYAHGNKDSDNEAPKFPQTSVLLKTESDVGDFSYGNWELIDSVSYEAEVEEVYPVDEKTTKHVYMMERMNDEFRGLSPTQVVDKVQTTLKQMKD